MSQFPDQLQRIRLVDLPNDIFQLIVRELLVHENLFTPVYKDSDANCAGLGELEAKCKEYYGARTEHEIECASGLYNWSLTSKHFRTLLAPNLFRSIVLRSSFRSIESVLQLSKSPHWFHVQRLQFAASPSTLEEAEDSGDGSDNGESLDPRSHEHFVGKTMRQLTSILSNLPPNLNHLSLDFPYGWDDDFSYDRLTNAFVLECEFNDRYDVIIRTVLEAISQNDISSKSTFELRLYNVPPLDGKGYDTAWHCFLEHVTSFTLGLCHYDNGAGWEMNTCEAVPEWAERLPEFFWNHLERAESIRLLCDDSWPLGDCDLMHPVPLLLPNSESKLPNLKRVTFGNTFICDQLIQFLVAHAHKLESIELIECYAPRETGNETPTWSDFFQALTDISQKLKKLCNFTMPESERSIQDFAEGSRSYMDSREYYEEIYAILAQQAIKEKQKIQDGANKEDIERRRKRMLRYARIDDKYGMLFFEYEAIAERFLAGQDHRAWIKLVDLIEENIERRKLKA